MLIWTGCIVVGASWTWTYGAPPRDLRDDEFINGWTELFRPYLDRIDVSASADGPA